MFSSPRMRASSPSVTRIVVQLSRRPTIQCRVFPQPASAPESDSTTRGRLSALRGRVHHVARCGLPRRLPQPIATRLPVVWTEAKTEQAESESAEASFQFCCLNLYVSV